MLRIIYKSKIHNATVTDANLDYTGSITIDSELLKLADIFPGEKVQVVNLNNGARLETYVIEGEKNSGEICINGAAARRIFKGEKIIILSFAYMEEKEASDYRPKIVYVNNKNEITNEENHVEEDDQC